MGKTSAAGSFQLLIGVASSTVIMSVGTIILIRLLSPSEYGLYSVALLPAATLNLFRDWGVNSAMTKYVANSRILDRSEDIRDVIAAGLIFEVAAGLALFLLSLLMASFVASVLNRPESASYIAIISTTIVAGSLISAAQSSFVGFERMELNSFMIICQAIVKTIVGPILVLLGYGVLGAVVGYTLSFAVSGIIGVLILYFMLFKPLGRLRTNASNIVKTLKKMLEYGIPLSMNIVLGGILAQLYGFIMASFASDAMIGDYQAAINFSVLLTFFSIPIATTLFPAFAKLDSRNDHELIKTVFSSSVKYTAVLLVPATTAVIVLSGPMISMLYGEKYVYAPLFLSVYVLSNLFTVLGSLSLGSLLSGLGEAKFIMKQSALTLVIGVPLGFFLIPRIGVMGLVVANILCGLPSMFWGLQWVSKRYEAKADLQSSAKILLASTVAAAAAYLTASFGVANWTKLLIGITVFLPIYLLTAPLIGAVNQTDVSNIRAMFSSMGPISKMINVPLNVVERALRFKKDGKRRIKHLFSGLSQLIMGLNGLFL